MIWTSTTTWTGAKPPDRKPRTPRRSPLAGLAMLGLVAGSTQALGADAAAGEAVFKHCASCHNIRTPGPRMGPHLMGVVGRPVGAVANFRFYSPAMRQAGLDGKIWTDELLAAFISSPGKALPGNSMRFFGLWSGADIANLIAYLKTVPAPDSGPSAAAPRP